MKTNVFFQKAVIVITALLILAGVASGTIGNYTHRSYLAALILAVLLFLGLLVVQKRRWVSFDWLNSMRPGAVCVALSTVCLVINALWILSFHPVQAADYQTYFQTAIDLANGFHPTGKDYVAMFPHILGYSAFLSIFLRVFGQRILVAAFVNVVLTVLTGIILYILAFKWTGNKIAAAVVLILWTICPSKLLYNAMTLSEPYYTFLILVFFLLVTTVFDGEDVSTVVVILHGMVAGGVLALVNAARPIGVIPIVAFLIWFLLLTDRKWRGKKGRAGRFFILTLVLCYLCSGKAWNSYAEKQLEQKLPSVPGYSIYVGFNPETQGSYADEDMDLLQSRYFGEYERNAQLAQQSMLESAKERILDNKKGIPSLMVHKLRTLLGHDEGGAFYSRESMTEKRYSFWCVASNIWYYFVCVLSVLGCVSAWKQNRSDSFWMVMLCIIGVILAQLLVEVAARYHYCLIPMLLLLMTPAYRTKGRNIDEKV